MAAQSSDAGWVEKVDPTTGKTYWYNKELKKSSWTKVDDTNQPTQATVVVVGGGLPEGWAEKVDPGSGKTYYYHKETKKSSWTRPTDSAPQPASGQTSGSGTPAPAAGTGVPAALPSGWTEKVDPGSGKTYYYNKESKKSSWTRPEDDKTTSASTSSKPVQSSEPQGAGELPSGWVEKVDPGTGKTYYFNKELKKSSWTVPSTTETARTADSASPAPATEAHRLPDGWVEKVDPSTGRSFYYNTVTKVSSWDRPQQAAGDEAAGDGHAAGTIDEPDAGSGVAQSAAPLPPGWVEKVDRKTGNTYYIHKASKKTTWDRPSAAVEEEPDSLPPHWVEKTDVVTGRKYYLHTLTKQPSWQRPTIANAEAAKRARQVLEASGTQTAVSPRRPSAAAADEDGESHGHATYGDARSYVTTSVEGLWEKRFEPRSGTFYYFNTRTHETRWDVSAAGSSVVVDVSHGDTIYVIGGQPRTTSVCKYDGGASGWLPCHAMDLPFDVDLPLAWVENDGGSIAVSGSRSAIVADVTMSLSLPRQGDPDTPGSALESTSAGAPVTIRNGMASAAVSGGLVVSGGYEDTHSKKPSPECFIIDSKSRRAIPLPPLQVARTSHALAVVDLSSEKHFSWYAFAIGGFDGAMKTNVVERYVLGQPYWEIVSPMRTPRAAHASVAVDKTIFVFGGRSGYTIVNTGEYLHCQSTAWMDTAPMRVSRCNFGAAAIQSFIFCVGGWSGSEWLSSVEAYDTRLDSWREVQQLPSPRGGFAIVKAPLALQRQRAQFSNAHRGSTEGTEKRQKTLAELVTADLFNARGAASPRR